MNLLPFWIYAVLGVLLIDYAQRQKGFQWIGAVLIAVISAGYMLLAAFVQIKAAFL